MIGHVQAKPIHAYSIYFVALTICLILNSCGGGGDGDGGGNGGGFATSPVIAAGSFHTVALRGDGTVWTWGENGDGQLGSGTTTDSAVPSRVSGLSEVIRIAAGYNHTIAIQSDGTEDGDENDGTVWTWGDNNSGQLGDDSATDRKTPVQVPGLTDVIAIAGGEFHTIALKNDGTVWAWGDDSCGQLANNFENSLTPVQVDFLFDAIAITAGGQHSMVLKQDGTVLAWGLNGNGQLGNGTTGTGSSCPDLGESNPVAVLNLSEPDGKLGSVKAIAAGNAHSLALKNGGTVWAWGLNRDGQLGYGTTNSEPPWGKSNPVQVIDSDDLTGLLTNVEAIAAGFNFSMALKNDGTVWAWGDNFDGQLGDDTFNDRASTVQVVGLWDGIAVAGGGNHSIAMKDAGTLWAWGENEGGQLGDGTTTNRATPMQVSGLDLLP